MKEEANNYYEWKRIGLPEPDNRINAGQCSADQGSDLSQWNANHQSDFFLSRFPLLFKCLPSIIDQFQINSILDVPCGDFSAIDKVDLGQATYIGGDIVPSLVRRNAVRFANQKRRFKVHNLLKDDFPKVDMVILRDCLAHFSFREIDAILTRIQIAGIKYVFLSTYPELSSNEDIETGAWRPINFTVAPFSLPAPLFQLKEQFIDCEGWVEEKYVGLWSASQFSGEIAEA